MPTPANPPICATCGYDLTGVAHVPGWRCPECGGRRLWSGDDTPRGVLALWVRTFNGPWAVTAALFLLVVTLELATWWFDRSPAAGLLGTLRMGSLGLGLLYVPLIMPAWMLYLGVQFVRALPTHADRSPGDARRRLAAVACGLATYLVTIAVVGGVVIVLWRLLSIH